MDAERLRGFLLELPHVEETMQWGANLVFWVGDKAIGGKMFALANLDEDGGPLLSFPAGPERYAELLELDGVVPAPYLARIHWVAITRWDAFSVRELHELLTRAHGLVYDKLAKRTRDTLSLPRGEQRRLIRERRIGERRKSIIARKK